jgi:hypothetical protein
MSRVFAILSEIRTSVENRFSLAYLAEISGAWGFFGERRRGLDAGGPGSNSAGAVPSRVRPGISSAERFTNSPASLSLAPNGQNLLTVAA